MENGGYKFKELCPGITLLYGFAQECCMFAVEGRDKVMLVDTGMGTGDLKKALEAIAPGKEIIAVNTHGHADHCGGNSQFPVIYLHEGSYPDADNAEEEKKTLPAENELEGITKYQWTKHPLKDGDLIDLGGKTIEVIETPGHTPGCISLLDREDRILFGGDLVVSNDHCTHMLAYVEWFKFSTVSIEAFHRSLLKVNSRRDEFDYILGGHDDFALDKKYLDQIIDMCGEILDGSAKPYHPQLAPHYGNISCWRLDRENTSILYHDEIIFDKKA